MAPQLQCVRRLYYIVWPPDVSLHSRAAVRAWHLSSSLSVCKHPCDRPTCSTATATSPSWVFQTLSSSRRGRLHPLTGTLLSLHMTPVLWFKWQSCDGRAPILCWCRSSAAPVWWFSCLCFQLGGYPDVWGGSEDDILALNPTSMSGKTHLKYGLLKNWIIEPMVPVVAWKEYPNLKWFKQ